MEVPALGASLGDYLSQDRADGGLGLGTVGTVGTSALFLATILGLVVSLTRTRRNRTVEPVETTGPVAQPR